MVLFVKSTQQTVGLYRSHSYGTLTIMTTVSERWWFLLVTVLTLEQSPVHSRYSSILQHTLRMFCTIISTSTKRSQERSVTWYLLTLLLLNEWIRFECSWYGVQFVLLVDSITNDFYVFWMNIYSKYQDVLICCIHKYYPILQHSSGSSLSTR